MLRTGKTFLSILTFLSICLGFESLPPLKWARSSKEINITPEHLTETASGQIISADSTRIVIIDINSGQAIRTVSGFSRINSIEPVSGGGFVVSDLNKITLLNSSFEVLWSKPVFAGKQNFTIKSVNQTSDSGFIALGEINTAMVKVIKTDRKGDTLWTRTKGDTAEMGVYQGTAVVEAEGVYIAAGVHCPGICKGLPGWVSAYSPQGNEIWAKSRPGFSIYGLKSVNNSVLITGSIENGSSSFTDMKVLDSFLKKISWFPAVDLIIVQMGKDGQVLFDSSYGMRTVNYGKTVEKVGNTFIVGGYAGVYNFSQGDQEQVVLAADMTGKILWKNSFKVDSSIPALAKQLSSGGLVVATADSIYLYEHESASKRTVRSVIIPEISFIQTGVQEKIVYTLANPSMVTFNLLNLRGQRVKAMGHSFMQAGTHSLPIPNCAPGSYLLEMRIGKSNILAGKVIVER